MQVNPNLTSEEFEEIVKIVLQNSCQKNLGMSDSEKKELME